MIPIARPFLGEEEAAAAREAILSGWVTQGPKVKEFETRFAQYTGAKYACAVSSCTTALHLALLAAGVVPGNVVLTTSHSFIATANAIRHCGAEPVFVDIESDSYNIDPELLDQILANQCYQKNNALYFKDTEKLITNHSPLIKGNEEIGRVGAILVVHQMGFPCDIKRIGKIGETYSIPVVEDSACAIGSEISMDNGTTWDTIGAPHGVSSCFSFHPRKILTTGDGGMITTNDEQMDQTFRLLRQHGMSVPDLARHNSKKVIFENYAVTGFNYRMTDIQAAIGIVQLERLPELIKRRRQLVQSYRVLLEKYDQDVIIKDSNIANYNWQSLPISLPERADQTMVIQALADRGIATRKGIMNIHQEEPYKNELWHLPESEKTHKGTILLPLYHDMSEDIIHEVVQGLAEVLKF